MRPTPAQSRAGEAGFVLIEVLVSAMVLLIAAGGVVLMLQTATTTQAEQRHSSEAYALAQEDQARLSSMRLSQLKHLDVVNPPVTLNKTTFYVRSKGVFINDVTSTPSCGEGTSSADYVEITSVVTWKGMDPGEKAKIVSILSPSNGSLNPNNGTIAFSVKNQPQVPMPGVEIFSGSTFYGVTDAVGCAVFPDLPAGNYMVTASGAKAGLVSREGGYTQQKEVGVFGGDTKTISLEFDRPGTIPVNFQYRISSTEPKRTATADSVVAFNTGGTRVVGTPGATRQPSMNATLLFPFTSAYTLYAGSCGSNKPEGTGSAAGLANVIAPAGGTAPTATLQLPALDLVVKNSSGTAIQGATVEIDDRLCDGPERTYTTNAEGKPSNSSTGIAEPALPWSKYEVCASAPISGKTRHDDISSITVQNLASATSATITLSSGDDSGSC